MLCTGTEHLAFAKTMDAFHYQDAYLYCEGIALGEIATNYGTPTYVYSRKQILANFDRLRRAVSGLPNLICYSVKANSNLRVLELLREAGAGFDIVSGGELERVLRINADPAGIVFSGVGKTAAEIDAGLEAGIHMFNVESASELEVIEARARSAGKAAPIAVRVNPDVEAETHPYISTGQMIHKFGVPKDEVVALYRRAAGSAHLRVRGIACHIGSQILAVEPFLKALDEILGLASELTGVGIPIENLDLGGGLGIRYTSEPPIDIARLASGIAERLCGTSYRLIIEPGRSIVGDAGILLTRVIYVKQSVGKLFVITDAGMNDLMRPALYGSYHEIQPVERRAGAQSPSGLRADVVGPLCETGDFLAQDRAMGDVRSGDLLAVMTAGAYGYVLTSNYNSRLRPAETLVSGERSELIRRRETMADLLTSENAAKSGH
jgi:diaminopimelate decarboxylase